MRCICGGMKTAIKNCGKVAKKRGRPFSKGDDPRRAKTRPGRPRKDQSITETIREMGRLLHDGQKTKAELLADMLWCQALNGDLRAAETILDRTEGKARQSMEISQPTSTIQVEIIPPGEKIENAGNGSLLENP